LGAIQKVVNSQFFPRGGEDHGQLQNSYQPIYSRGRGSEWGFRGNRKYWVRFGRGGYLAKILEKFEFGF
jgi:hypothetical protein